MAGTKDEQIDRIIGNVLKDVKPDNDILSHVSKIVDSINMLLKKSKIDAECIPGGSIAKDTFLKNDHDIDLFIRFSMAYKNKNISDMVDKTLSKEFSMKRIHGSRDYFQFQKKDGKIILNFEIVPVLKVKNYKEALNVTDLSPEHVTWVKKKTDKNKRLLDDIRVAKQFCKANDVYGAESYINGFSGHTIDILIIHFGSFKKMILEFSKIKFLSKDKPMIIDTEKHLKDPLKELNSSKISPLILVDPIQPDRNAAAALSLQKLNVFIDSCRRFLKDPSKDFFIVKEKKIKSMIDSDIKKISKKNSLKIISMKITMHDDSKDVMGTKLLKIYEEIIRHNADFKIISSGWIFDYSKKEGSMYFIFDNIELSERAEQEGPPLSSENACDNFRKTHINDKIFKKKNRLYAIVRRKFRTPEAWIKDFIRRDFIIKRARNINIDDVQVR